MLRKNCGPPFSREKDTRLLCGGAGFRKGKAAVFVLRGNFRKKERAGKSQPLLLTNPLNSSTKLQTDPTLQNNIFWMCITFRGLPGVV
jgi:hypothetical protein